jgi:hypothetical protein
MLAPYIHPNYHLHLRFCAEKRLVVAGAIFVAIGRQRVVDEFETARSGQHWAIYGETLVLLRANALGEKIQTCIRWG